jgi:hypothetical protein
LKSKAESAGAVKQKAQYGTLFQSASTSALGEALTAVCWSRRLRIPLGRCSADHDSGRGTGQRYFDPEDVSFRRASCLCLKAWEVRSYVTKMRDMGVSFRKSHRMTFYEMLMRTRILLLDSP